MITNLGKLIGFGIAINEAVVRTEGRNSVILLCVVFVLGTQSIEMVALRVIDRLFGSPR